ncbi:MAG: hypothetical protein ACXWMB_07030, partial [Candidatus Limnocylindria bacterium]
MLRQGRRRDRLAVDPLDDQLAEWTDGRDESRQRAHRGDAHLGVVSRWQPDEAATAALEVQRRLAVDRLRGDREVPAERRTVLLATADPAQPYGAALAWPRRGDEDRASLQRVAGAYVVLVNGEAALYLERGGRSLVTLPATDDPEVAVAALSVLPQLVAPIGPFRELVIER